MINLKKKSWNDITIKEYDRITAIVEDEFNSPMEANIKTLAILCDVPEEEIWNMDITELRHLLSQTEWLSEFDFPRDLRTKKVRIQGVDYEINTDISTFTVAQYIDFQNLWRDHSKHKGAFLTVILVPRGKKYNEGYDTAALAEVLENNLSIVDWNAICFFFLKEWLNLIKGFQLYSYLMLKKMKKKATPGLREKTEEALSQIEEMMRMLGSV